MLTDLRRVSEREDVEAGTLKRVAATLLAKQFLYSDKDKERKSYLVLAGHAAYFENLFDAIDHDFVLDQELGMVGVLPRGRMSSQRLKKEEALLLLTLRLVYEDALERFEIKNGCAHTNSEKLLAKYLVSTGAEQRPLLTDLRRLLIEFKRSGLVDDIQENSNRLLDFRIRPAVRLVLNESWFQVLEQHAGIIHDEEDSDTDDDDGEENEEVQGPVAEEAE
ncbi:DUF4194 domain-containing protein [Desulfuromonas carbonis]